MRRSAGTDEFRTGQRYLSRDEHAAIRAPRTRRGEIDMPMTFLEAPAGIPDDAERRLVDRMTAALDAAYRGPHRDYRIFVREYPPDDVAQRGHLGEAPVGPVYVIEDPPLPRVDARREPIAELDAALAVAYRGPADTGEIMILIDEYALEDAGAGGRLTSEDPAIVAAPAARGAQP